VRVDVAITRRDRGRLELRVRWTGGDNSGQRQLEAESCRAALDTAAWLIALAVKSSDPKLTAAEPARAPSLRYELGAGALLDSASLPKAGLGSAARAGLAAGAWRVMLSGAYLLPQDQTLGSARGTVRVIEIAVTGCHLWDIYPVAMGPCLRAAMGSMSASSLSVLEPTTGSGRSQSLSAGAEARLRLADSIALFSDISLVWNQRRPEGSCCSEPGRCSSPAAGGCGSISAFCGLPCNGKVRIRPPIRDDAQMRREAQQTDAAWQTPQGSSSDHADEFSRLYTEHFDFVWRTARYLGEPDASLDDAAQDVFLVAYRRLQDFQARASTRSWLFAITMRVTSDHRRSRRRKRRLLDGIRGVPPKSVVTPYEQTAHKEQGHSLMQALSMLSESHRVTFVMADLEGMTAPEIATTLGVNMNTVYSRLRVSRIVVKRALEQAKQEVEDA
jgi:RNA polymerase sigma-70 factor (ECF subfamily)